MKLFYLIVVFMFSQQVLACDDTKVGYWWYCEPETKEDPHAIPEREPLPPPPTQQAMMQMHPDDIDSLREQYLKEAVWQTSPNNVRNYYQVLDVARKKSLAFANVTKLVMLQNPDLNAYGQYTKTNPGRKALNQHKAAQIRAALTHYKNEFGLILFTQKSCIFCRSQHAVLGSYSDRHGWPVKTIDIDHNPVAAARFNVTTVPVTMIVQKSTDKWMPVAVGEEALTTIEFNVYRGIRYLNGDTTPSQFLQMEYEDGSISDPDHLVDKRALEARL